MQKDSNPSKRDTSNANDARNRSVTRRSYLKTVGSAAGAATLLGSADTAAAAPTNTGSVSKSNCTETDHGDYIEVTVGAGGTWSCSLGDNDVLSNYLIDISANNANAQINPTGTGWTVENVGFRGVSDDVGDMPKKHITPLVPSGGTGTIRNVYMGDGAVSDSRKGAIWVSPYHAGEVLIQQVYIAGWADNGIYGSPPGNPSTHTDPGAGGTVKIEDSYGENNAVSSFRIGSTGSYCRNCVAVGGDRGFWGYYEETDYVDCDSSNAGEQFRAGAKVYEKAKNAVVNLTRCEAEGTINGGPGTVNGSPGNNPRTSPPSGVPTSAVEAARGTGDGGGGSNASEVAEDFSHNDIPGTYSLDTGAFATTSTRSTSDSYAIQPTDSTDGGNLILRDDMATTAGNTYELDVYHQSSSNADMGFLFGAQSGVTSWSDYTGYFAFFDSNADEIRLDYWANGSQSNTAATAVTWPLDEWLTVELDYRNSDSSTITMTVFDASGQQLGSVSLGDTTRDSGTVGWYNYHATSDWFADSWFDASVRNRSEVAEDFSHNDIPGTYSLDTGAFATTSTRSTTDSYAIQPTDSTDGGNLILRDDMATTAGNTYELDVYHQSSSNADMGFLFGAQSATSWSDYTGYFAFFDSNTDEIRLDYWENGSQINSSATAVTWPLGEWLTVELDYRSTDSSTVTMTVFDASGQQLGSVSLADTTHDSGTVGWYNYHATSDWFADSWFSADASGDSSTVVDDFEDGDLAEYAFDRGSASASVVSSPTRGGSYALEYTDTSVEAISTSGLNAYPSAGDTFSYWVRGSGGAGKTSFTYGVQDHQNRYFARVDIAADSLALYKVENGTSKSFASDWDTPTLSQDAWYRVEVQWGTDGSHTATLYDASGSQLAQVPGTDSTWTSGGIGFDAYLSSGQSAYFDDVTIE